MPEMPEVQALTDALARRTVGTMVSRVTLGQLAALKTFDPPVSDLVGAHVTGITRIGKFISWSLVTSDGEEVWLVIHLARAGWIRWTEKPSTAPVKPGRGPLALRVVFENHAGDTIGGIDVTEAGTKKSLAVYLARDPHAIAGVARLGPDPMAPEFSLDQLNAILDEAGGKQLKGVLRSQAVLAGIGNAYSDEILHVARLSPFSAAGKLNDDQRSRLFAAIRETLTAAVDRAQGSSPETLKAEKKAHMAVHGRTGDKCPACGDVVRQVSFANSSLQYCATCQTDGKILADRRMSKLLK